MGGNVLATVIVNAAGAKVEQMGNSMDLPPEMAADMQARPIKNKGHLFQFNTGLVHTARDDYFPRGKTCHDIKNYQLFVEGRASTT